MGVIAVILMIIGSPFTYFGFMALFIGQIFMASILLLPIILAIILIILRKRLRNSVSYTKLKCSSCGFKMDGTLLFCPECGESTRH